MKLNDFDIDLQPEDIAVLNTPDKFKNRININDAKLSMDLPIVVKYDYVDLGVTDYHFKQEFTLLDTQKYFSMMKKISSNTINKLSQNSSFSKLRDTGKYLAQIFVRVNLAELATLDNGVNNAGPFCV